MLIRIYNSQYPTIPPSIFIYNTFRALEANTNSRNVVNEKGVRFWNEHFGFIFLNIAVLSSSRLVFTVYHVIGLMLEKHSFLGEGCRNLWDTRKRIVQSSLYGHVLLNLKKKKLLNYVFGVN